MQDFSDPHALEGAHKLYAQLGDDQRRELNELHEQVRVYVRRTIETLKATSDPAHQQGALSSLHLGAADLLHTVTDASYKETLAQKLTEPVACGKGCAFCCYLSVETTIPAAVAVAAFVESSRPDLKAGLIETARKITGLSQNQRAAQHVPCPYLSHNVCQVYDVRPLSCRSHYSFDRGACETERRSGGTICDIPVYGLPRVLNTMIAGGFAAAAADLGLQNCAVELTEATALILSDPSAVPRWLAGEQVFAPFLRS